MSDPLFFDNDKNQNYGLKQKLTSLNPYIISGLSLAMLVVIVLSIWTFYPADEIDPESLPVIEARNDAVRMKPEESEITENSGFNSRIYETFGNSNQPRNIENLLQPQENVENPVARDDLFAGLNTADEENTQNKVISITESPFAEAPSSEETLQSSSEAAEQDSIASEDSQEINDDLAQSQKRAMPGIFDNNQDDQPISNTATEEVEQTEPAAGSMAKAPNVVEPTEPVEKKPEAGNYYVQLASIQDQSRTSESWDKLTTQYSSLKSVSYRTQAAEIEGKGTFYRIQAGPFSKSAAEQLCQDIKAKSGSCLVTAK